MVGVSSELGLVRPIVYGRKNRFFVIAQRFADTARLVFVFKMSWKTLPGHHPWGLEPPRSGDGQ